MGAKAKKTDRVKGRLPAGGQDGLAVVVVPEVAAEGSHAEHAAVDLRVKAPAKVSIFHRLVIITYQAFQTPSGRHAASNRDTACLPANAGHGPVEAPPYERWVVPENLPDGELVLGLVVDPDGLALEVDVLDARDAGFFLLLYGG